MKTVNGICGVFLCFMGFAAYGANPTDGILIKEVDVPLKVESIQEALDVLLLYSQGRSASDKDLNDCKINDGCAVMAGIVRARWKIVEIQGCSLRKDNLVSCKFTYRAESASTLSPNTSNGNRLLDGVMGMTIIEADTLLRLKNGKWRFIPL